MRYPGFDYVRLLAMGLVTLQHAFTLMGHDAWTQFAGIELGQVGVALFLFISGFLAAQSTRPPWEWLKQRLWRILPAYWIVLAGSFVLAYLGGNRDITWQLVLGQFSTVTFWTPDRWKMINDPTWFISVLMLAYAIIFIVRHIPWEQGLYVVIATGFLIASLKQDKPWLCIHFFVFFVGAGIGSFGIFRKSLRMLGVLTVCAFFGLTRHPDYFSAAITFAIIMVTLQITTVPKWMIVAGAYSYEYFLIHGVALNIALKKLPVDPWLAVGIAIVASMVAAVVLHTVIERILFNQSAAQAKT